MYSKFKVSERIFVYITLGFIILILLAVFQNCESGTIIIPSTSTTSIPPVPKPFPSPRDLNDISPSSSPSSPYRPSSTYTNNPSPTLATHPSPSPTPATPCTEEETRQGFKMKNHRCLPSCEYFHQEGMNAPGVTMGKDTQCEETSRYHILPIQHPVHDAEKCCRKSSRMNCPSGYQKLTRNDGTYCFPNCGTAASYAGYGGLGPDRRRNTPDDPHILSVGASCSTLTANGRSDWSDFEFYDPYTLLPDLSSRQDVYEVINRGSNNENLVCCKRGTQTNLSVDYREDGTHPGEDEALVFDD